MSSCVGVGVGVSRVVGRREVERHWHSGLMALSWVLLCCSSVKDFSWDVKGWLGWVVASWDTCGERGGGSERGLGGGGSALFENWGMK